MDKRAPVQGERLAGLLHMAPGTIAWDEHLEVWNAYAAMFGKNQSAERIAERGGFGHFEATALLGRPLRTWIQSANHE